MNADDCNGRSHMSGSGGESATERDFDGGLKGPTVCTPNSQQSSPKRSLSANSIKVELYSDDESAGAPQRESRGGERDDRWKDDRGAIEAGSADQGGRVRGGTGSGYSELASPKPVSPDPIRLANGKLKCDICGMICIGPNVLMVHKRSHTGERPFQCNQCGASFTQKGNLLRHVKLHSGEKPFKCPFCSYACRRRDALSGHLRTHAVSSLTVGKPFKCSYCGRSYKQQSTLEEHCERCHSYLQSLDHQPALSTQTAQAFADVGEESRSLELMTEPILQPSTEKLTVMDRLANSITKRKRSTPQKFLGEKRMRLNLLDAPHELSSSSEKERDLYSSHPGGDPAGLVRMEGRYLQGSSAGGGDPEPPRPPLPQCIRMPEHTPVISSLYSHMAPLRPRANCGGGVAAMSAGLTGREADEGHEDVPSRHSHTASPSNGCHHDSTDTESTVEEQSTGAAAPTSNSNHHHHPVSALPRGCPRSTHAKDREPEWEKACPVPVTPATVKGGHSGSPHSREAVQVVDGQGRAVRSYHCEHCGIFFLDHVMFTIHMGCHGFRQPFECNICGHLSQDHYEFSSHMTRGEHKVG